MKRFVNRVLSVCPKCGAATAGGRYVFYRDYEGYQTCIYCGYVAYDKKLLGGFAYGQKSGGALSPRFN